MFPAPGWFRSFHVDSESTSNTEETTSGQQHLPDQEQTHRFKKKSWLSKAAFLEVDPHPMQVGDLYIAPRFKSNN